MRRYTLTIASLVCFAALTMLGCAGTYGSAADDDFGGGMINMPPLIAERPIQGDGASLYASNCTRCHTARWASERTDAEWQSIMLHMRSVGTIPGEDAQAILDYLRSSN